MRRYFISKTINSNKDFVQCSKCHKKFDINDMAEMENEQYNNVYLCDDCFDKHAIQCDNCRQWIIDSEENKIGDKYVCYNCKQYYQQCFHCGEYFNSQEQGGQLQDDYYCQQCLQECAFCCQKCGEMFSQQNSTYTYDQDGYEILVCEDCKSSYVKQCYFCEDDINIHNNRESYFYLHDGEIICQYCFSNRCGVCEDCGEVYELDDLSIGDDQCFYCTDCIAHQVSQSIDPQFQKNDIVYPYNKKITTDFKKVDNQPQTKQYIGVQLQIRNKNKSVQQTDKFVKQASKNKNIIFKQDGSVSSGGNVGVQIVSKPCTYNFHKHGFGWQRIFHYMKEYDMVNTDNCGLHFHISRNNFTEDQQKCLDYFVNNAVSFLSDIGGRNYSDTNEGQYCYSVKKNDEEYGENKRNRYQAVNFENDDTIQLRFFKSTNSFSSFRKRLGTVHNLCKLAKFFTFDQLKTLDETDLKYCFHQIVKNIY